MALDQRRVHVEQRDLRLVRVGHHAAGHVRGGSRPLREACRHQARRCRTRPWRSGDLRAAPPPGRRPSSRPREQLARVPRADQLDERVVRLRVLPRLVARDHLHLAAAQAGRDLEAVEALDLCLGHPQRLRHPRLRAGRTGGSCPARSRCARPWPPGRPAWTRPRPTSPGARAAAPAGPPPSASRAPPPRAPCRPGRSRTPPRARAPACGWRPGPRRSPSGGSAASARAGCPRSAPRAPRRAPAAGPRTAPPPRRSCRRRSGRARRS